MNVGGTRSVQQKRVDTAGVTLVLVNNKTRLGCAVSVGAGPELKRPDNAAEKTVDCVRYDQVVRLRVGGEGWRLQVGVANRPRICSSQSASY
jgi:hypothetical protein